MEQKIAFLGGTKARNEKIVAKTITTDVSRQRINEVLDEGQYSYWYGGKYVRYFENEYANWNGVKHAIAVNSGTAALHVAVIAAGIMPGDEVIIPTTSFVTAVSAILLQNAIPVPCDIDTNSLNINIDDLINKITNKTTAILVVHLYGYPSNMVEIKKIAQRHKLKIIEDCAQAHGAMINGEKVGTFGDIACFSFSAPRKHINVGEGGIVITNNSNMEKCARQIVNKGKDNGWSTHRRMGFSYIMPEIEAILGLQGLNNLSYEIEKRRTASKIYDEVLQDSGLELETVPKEYQHVYFRKVIKLPLELKRYTGWFIHAVSAENISIKPPHDMLHKIEWIKNNLAYGKNCCHYKWTLNNDYNLPLAEEIIPRTVDVETGPNFSEEDAYVSAEGILKVFNYLCENYTHIDPIEYV